MEVEVSREAAIELEEAAIWYEKNKRDWACAL